VEKSASYKDFRHSMGQDLMKSVRYLRECSRCKGKGMIIDNDGDSCDCPHCDGRGKIEEIHVR
jgi:DnaJ-class molecular chaperone